MDVKSLVATRVQNPIVDRKLNLTRHSYKKYLLLYLNTPDDMLFWEAWKCSSSCVNQPLRLTWLAGFAISSNVVTCSQAPL